MNERQVKEGKKVLRAVFELEGTGQPDKWYKAYVIAGDHLRALRVSKEDTRILAKEVRADMEKEKEDKMSTSPRNAAKNAIRDLFTVEESGDAAQYSRTRQHVMGRLADYNLTFDEMNELAKEVRDEMDAEKAVENARIRVTNAIGDGLSETEDRGVEMVCGYAHHDGEPGKSEFIANVLVDDVEYFATITVSVSPV